MLSEFLLAVLTDPRSHRTLRTVRRRRVADFHGEVEESIVEGAMSALGGDPIKEFSNPRLSPSFPVIIAADHPTDPAHDV